MKSLPCSSLTHPIHRRDAFRIFGLAGAAALIAPQLLRAGEPSLTTNTAPSLAGSEPGFHRFKIGAIEALTLHDGGFAAPYNNSPFGVGESPDKITATLHDAYLPSDKVEVPFNVLLVRVGSELVLVDSGCGSLYGPAGGQLLGNLASAGIKPEQITGLILTHLHGDHFGGLVDAVTSEPVFKNAKLFIHKKEFEFWNAAMPDLSTQFGESEAKKVFVTRAQACLKALQGKWEFIQGGDKLIDGVEIVDAFGHTPGHIALVFSSGPEQLFHFVDAAHNHAVSFAHPEWKLAFDVQPDLAVATRKRLLDRAATDRSRVFGGHMPFPSLGHVRARANGFEFVIEPSSIS